MSTKHIDDLETESFPAPHAHTPPENGRALLPASSDPIGFSEADSVTIRDLIDILHRRKWWMLLGFIGVLALGIFWTMTRTRIYSSTAEIMVAQSAQAGSSSDIPLLNDLAGLTKSRSIATQVRVLQSPDLLRQAYLSLPSATRDKLGSFATVRGSTIINSMKDVDIIVITVHAPDAGAAADMANSIVSTYSERDLEVNRKATRTASQFIEEELERSGDELNTARRALAEYKAQTGFYVLDATLNQKVEYAGRLDEELKRGMRDLQEVEEVKAKIADTLSTTDKEIIARVDEADNPVRNEIASQLEKLEAKRVELLQTLMPATPEVKAVDEQIVAARKRLADHLTMRVIGQQLTPNPVHLAMQQQYVNAQVQIDGVRVRVAALQRQLAAHRAELSKLPEQELVATELMSQVNQSQNMYTLLSEKYQTLRISEEARLTNVQIVTQARVEGTPISPRVQFNILASILVGLLIAVGLAALLEALDDRIHTTETLERLCTRPVLAQIPFVSDGAPNLINRTDHRSALLEGFRLLRGNLLFAGLDKAQRLIGVSSAGAGEGKSTTAINLGIALAMDGKNVVIVDCDLRKPSLHNYFALSRATGLTDLITGGHKLEDVIQQTTVERLSLLPTGPLPPNPPEVLNSRGTRALFAQLATMYDTVIVDMPPTTGFSDVPVLSTMIDALLLVVSAEETHRGQLQAALRALQQVDAPLLGFVYNKFSHLRSNSYYYYYYYGEGGSQSGERQKRRKRRQQHTPAPAQSSTPTEE